jgi:hypothetical protein
MALSLAFHIIFATAGIGMPVLMAISEGLYLRRKNPIYLELTKRWAKGTAILFAVGAEGFNSGNSASPFNAAARPAFPQRNRAPADEQSPACSIVLSPDSKCRDPTLTFAYQPAEYAQPVWQCRIPGRAQLPVPTKLPEPAQC